MKRGSGRKTQGLLIAIALLFAILAPAVPADAGRPGEVPASVESILDVGGSVNGKMKSLASGTIVDQFAETNDIKAIRMADSLPAGFVPTEANTVSTPQSKVPVHIFFDNTNGAGILYFYTEDDTVVMNPDSSYLFAGNKALTDLSGIAGWDATYVYSFFGAFGNNPSLPDLAPLAGWNTGTLTNLGRAFAGNTALTDISALANWNTSGVTSMQGLFSGDKSLPDALALRNWDTSRVTNMSYMFSNNISLQFVDVSNWNTGSVTTMASMFQVGESWKANGQLIEINGLGDLDVSNVTDMTCMFYGAGQMTYYDVSRWNVSKVESMNHMFCDNFTLRSLDLSNWDVSSLKTVYCMFDDNKKLLTIGDVSHWNTASLIDAGAWLNNACSFVGDNYGTLDLSGWDTSSLKSAGEMFFNIKCRTLDLSGWTFDAMTNDVWEGTGRGIFYETGNMQEEYKGMGAMLRHTPNLITVYVSQAGMDSFLAAQERGVNTENFGAGCPAGRFTVK